MMKHKPLTMKQKLLVVWWVRGTFGLLIVAVLMWGAWQGFSQYVGSFRFHTPAVAVSKSGPVAKTVVVHKGQTLWSIVNKLYPNSDKEKLVTAIEGLNQIRNPKNLQIGQVLNLP